MSHEFPPNIPIVRAYLAKLNFSVLLYCPNLSFTLNESSFYKFVKDQLPSFLWLSIFFLKLSLKLSIFFCFKAQMLK